MHKVPAKECEIRSPPKKQKNTETVYFYPAMHANLARCPVFRELCQAHQSGNRLVLFPKQDGGRTTTTDRLLSSRPL